MSKLVMLSLLLLATTFGTSARNLNDVTQVPDEPPLVSAPLPDLPDSNVPPFTAIPTTNTAAAPIPEEPAPVIAPVPDLPKSDVSPIPHGSAPAVAPLPDVPNSDAPPLTAPTAATSTTNAAAALPVLEQPAPASEAPPLTTNAAAAAAPITEQPAPTSDAPPLIAGSPTFSFFMHDILGGSHPSGRAVAGIVASSDANNLPFSKTSNQIFPINGGVPLNTVNGVVNNNNLPFLVGLNGSPSNTLVQNNGNNAAAVAGGTQPFVTAGQLPAGLTLQQLTFGSVTVVDNELTAGHELGSGVLGRAQGFYLTSSSDGSSHTVVLTAMFHGGEEFDTLSFFGVHRTATHISDISIVGGTGKYENAKGFASIETLPHVDQHTTDGVETITHFTIYLTP